MMHECHFFFYFLSSVKSNWTLKRERAILREKEIDLFSEMKREKVVNILEETDTKKQRFGNTTSKGQRNGKVTYRKIPNISPPKNRVNDEFQV